MAYAIRVVTKTVRKTLRNAILAAMLCTIAFMTLFAFILSALFT